MAFGKPFQKGQSGNPGGAPRGLLRRIREETGDDVPRFYRILRDLACGEQVDGYTDAEVKDRLKAGEMWVDRLLGKPKQSMDLNDKTPERPPFDWSTVPIEKRRELLAVLEQLGALTADGEPNGTEH